MLATFKFGNYLSFRGENSFTMIPESIKDGENYLHSGFSYDNNLQLLKSIGIFGHNSHGKSNLIKAIEFFQSFTLTTKNRKVNDSINVEGFSLNTANFDQPSNFEVTFYVQEYKYRYGFKVAPNNIIIEEWLFYALSKIKENFLFIRAAQEYKLNKTWDKAAGISLAKSIHFTERHELLLSNLFATDNKPPHVENIKCWIKNILLISDISDEKYF